jgi:F-type H+-transporting ATPase subunit gamma
MKAIKRRITSVKNTQQIMKAMNLVAASKVQKNKSKLESIKPLYDEARLFITQGVTSRDAHSTDYYNAREVKRTAYVVLSGERGLCGGYNANVLKEALKHMTGEMDAPAANESIVAVGAKCKEFYVRRRKKVTAEHIGVLETVTYDTATKIAEELLELYNSNDSEKRVDEIYVVYTQFETLLSLTPTVAKLLPLQSANSAEPVKEAIYEPDIETYLRKSVPIYIAMFLYGAMVESSTCEQAARMTSMDSAARNAEEIVDKLTLQYNRQRQSAITQEISEIVGGANAI